MLLFSNTYLFCRSEEERLHRVAYLIALSLCTEITASGGRRYFKLVNFSFYGDFDILTTLTMTLKILQRP